MKTGIMQRGNQKGGRHRFQWIVFSLALVVGMSPIVQASPILPGFDYFMTPPGGAVLPPDAGPLAGLPLMGVPIPGFGGADTIVERLTELPDGETGRIDTELVGLSLMSVSPVELGGSFFDVFVTLDPSMPSMGYIDITTHDDTLPNGGGGTFNSFFDIFTEISFSPVGPVPTTTGVPDPVKRHDTLTSQGSLWQHDPLPGFPDQGGFSPTVLRHVGPHPQITPVPVPEPAVSLLLGLGMAGVVLVQRVRTRFGK